jgi:hypothetical protein
MRKAKWVRARPAEATQKKERQTIALPSLVIEELLYSKTLHFKTAAGIIVL